MAGEGGAWVREGPGEQTPLLVLPGVQESRTPPPPPIGPRSGPPALAFPHLEEPGEDVKFEDGHVATAGEVDGGAQGEGCGA